MPEAAEVELVRRTLEPLVGLPLSAVETSDPQLVGVAEPLAGRTVSRIARIGKRLAIEFDDDALIIHLRMTGTLTIANRDDSPPIARAVLGFGTVQLVFTDLRRLGSWRVATAASVGTGLGADLLDAPAEVFRAASVECSTRSRAAKALMLDQSGPIAGAGNYLVDETLFHAGIFPGTLARSLAPDQWIEIWQQCRALAERALNSRPYPLTDYIAAEGTRGLHADRLVCYGRHGRTCVRCESTLHFLMIAARGTTYCPVCQPSD